MSLVMILALFITFSALLFYEEGIYWDPLDIMINFCLMIVYSIATMILSGINFVLSLGDKEGVNG